MTWEIALVLVLLAGALVSFISEKVTPDVTALSLFLVIVLSGLLTEAQAFSVLANPAPVTVGAMFILSAALVKCGAIDRLATLLDRLAGLHYFTVMLLLVLSTAAVSAFINNTPVVAVFVPVVLDLARKMRRPASKFLIPLSFAAVLGGCCTLIGTSTNLVVAGIVRERGLPPLGMFEFAWIGLPMLAAGALYIALAGNRLLPARTEPVATVGAEDRREYLSEVFVPAGSPAAGRTPAQAGLLPARGIRVLEIVRDEISLEADLGAVALQPGDRLVLSCRPQGVAHARSLAGLDLTAEQGLGQIAAHESALVETIVGPNSSFIGRSSREINFREHHRLTPLALHRDGRNLAPPFDTVPLRFGDILLMMGTDPAIENLRSSRDLLLIDRPRLPAQTRPRQLLIVLGSIAGVVLASTFSVLSTEMAAILACVIVFATGCLKPKEGYQAVEWNLLFLIYGMLALGLAMEKTGTSVFLVDRLLWLGNQFVPPEHKAIVMLAAFYLVTSVLTEILSNNAVAALMTPLAISLASQIGVDSRPFIIVVCIAASASFATPIGYQTNTYVYGIGGYRFSDFVRIGTPLNAICLIIALVVIPAVWPF
ncbi:MAG: SLC13 family permease [Opitutaceae bacterium]|nr:SLC13 family permease [Opitutaceae bacterium]